jgi:hypothetical protein
MEAHMELWWIGPGGSVEHRWWNNGSWKGSGHQDRVQDCANEKIV